MSFYLLNFVLFISKVADNDEMGKRYQKMCNDAARNAPRGLPILVAFPGMKTHA